MNDKNHGEGGSYVINDAGERELVERTQERADAPAEPPTLTDVVQPEQPADAGFFTPAAPADQPTAEQA